MEFFGAYSRALTNEEDEFPYLCLRKAFWNKDSQLQYSKKIKAQKNIFMGNHKLALFYFF